MAEPPAAATTEVPAKTETTAPAPAAAEATPAAPAPAKSAAPAKKSYSTDPALYIYTSLTAGSSHIVTATSRLETILKANRVPFKALDIAVDEKARMLWGRRAGKDESGRVRKLPGLVQMGMVLGDLFEIEEWNEYGELKQHVKIYYDEFTIPAKGAKQVPNKLKKPVYGNSVAPSKVAPAGGVATAATSSGPPKAIPAAPPLPEKKAGGAPANTAGANKAAGAATPAAPTMSIAEQAAQKAEQKAQKAKQARLESLRAKVHGAKEAREKEAAAAAAAAKDGTGEDALTVSTSPSAEAPAGAAALQSPTSGAWKSSGAPQEDSLRNVLQSPTSGTWKAGDTIVDLPVREHRGSSIVEASKEEIAAIEKAGAIPEAAVESSGEEDETKK
ncbi:hypothetical protein PFICI_01421 [Pestalotiopsis fici W106-1]|uniref:Glutaredoxin domain-containing protein n=1 Tax=Pestalotiopsis fici (strain W106-1 / CGMCC3.15140) TaxID=1229662 RepID=W3XNF9_PESFW|nr:uncharacterized protein PFICI_01421 [Pestalotiopsis fici W106-1]ETS87593.1 hypothetical protein PFICI_01421 [Pestalotiopsis fici W106-1]